MLISVHRQSRLRSAHAHPGLDIYVIIHPIHVGIGMVDHIVFYIPHEGTSPKHIQGKSSHVVDPFVLAETAMRAIMHYIKPNPGHNYTQKAAFQDSPYRSGRKKNKVNIEKQKRSH